MSSFQDRLLKSYEYWDGEPGEHMVFSNCILKRDLFSTLPDKAWDRVEIDYNDERVRLFASEEDEEPEIEFTIKITLEPA